MDRIRESRRAGASNIPNGLSRQRHRTSSFRDSPDDEARLRERGAKRDRERERDRDREKERERSRSSKRRRADRLMNAGDESEEEEDDESVNDEDDDDDDVDDVNFSRMLPPLPSFSSNNNYNCNSVQSHSHNLNRKSLLAENGGGGKVIKAAAWRGSHAVGGDEMIGVSVPRKARTASTKRSHDWIGGGGGGGGGGGEQLNHRQASSSPVRGGGGGGGIVMSTQGVRDAAALSPPSTSNVSIKKKIRPSGGVKLRPQPRSTTTSKSSSSNNNPEELEIEIAEVLYGLMTQSQAPSKNDSLSKNEFNSNKSSSEAKSRASSPVSNSSSAAPITAVAPKRKKARQVVDNNVVGNSSRRSSPTMKAEIDQTPRSEVCPPNLERNIGSAAENGESANSGKSGAEDNQHHPKSMKLEASTLTESKGALMEEAGESQDAVSIIKEEVNSIKKDSPIVKLKDDPKTMVVTSMATSTNVITEAPANEKKREESFQIDLMAPPPQSRSSPERDRAVNFTSDRDRMVFDMEMKGETSKAKETGKVGINKEDAGIQSDEKNGKTGIVEVEFQNSLHSQERNIDLHFDLEKPGTETVKNPQHDHVVQSQVQYSKAKPTLKEEQQSSKDRSAQSISLPLPMSVASWPGGIPPPIGYMTPLQGIVSVEGNTMPSAPVQSIFSQPRPKRCATHCHIARNIQYYQQLMKMNPFWPAPSGTASMFGVKSANVMPPMELQGTSSGRSLNSTQDKGNSLAIFPGSAVKETLAQPAIIADAGHGKQQILLQQAFPPVPPNNMMHGPAFIFPFNQQQAAVVAASGRPAPAKSPTTTGSLPCTGAPNLTTVTASVSAPANASALGFNYPNMPANETQYLVLQNSPYPFPIPAVGASQNFRGHAQPMPLFNGSFYPSQMIHPLQLQQQQAPTSQQQQQIQQTHQNTSSGPTSSQKHLQSEQHRPQGIAISGGGTGNGVLQNFAAPKSRSSQHPQQNQNQHTPPSQARQLESKVGGEDSPSTVDSRGSRAPMNLYNQNFAMPINPQNFALMSSSSAASAGATGASGWNQSDKKQTHHQHPGFKSGAESLPSQAFAMSFGPMVGSTSASGIDLSSMSQNHAILQSLPEATRQSYHQVMQAAATAQAVQQKKNSRLSEDGIIGGAVSINIDDERKVMIGNGPASSGGQSISFSRPDFADASESATSKDSASNNMARMLNLAPGSTHMTNGMHLGGSSSSCLHAQLQHQQQLIQMHNQQQHQQQQLAANVTVRSKTPTSNGIASSEHLTSSSGAGKFPNSVSGFPPNFVQSNNNSSSMQSSQWKNSNRTPTSQVQSSLVSSTSSPKNYQQQQSRTLQNHTQISFGTNQKPSASQGQQHLNSSQSPSPPVAVGSPTHSSLSKGASSSPRTITAPTNKTGQASTLSSQQPKNSTSVPSQKSSPAGGRNVPSVLGNPHSASQSTTTKTQIQMQQLQPQQRNQQFQQQLSKQTLQQALFFSNPYFQGQPPNPASSNASAASGYNLQRRHSEQAQGSSPSSSGMLSACPPATQSNTSTTDPAKAAAAAAAMAAAASNMKGGGFSSQGILHSAQFGVQSGNSHQILPVGFSFGHSIPAAVQVKPTEQKQPPEQKQPAA